MSDKEEQLEYMDQVHNTELQKMQSKEFFNDSFEEHGAVSWRVRWPYISDRVEKFNKREVYADLRIQDCSRYIFLEFSFTGKTVKHRLNKIDTLIDSLMKFREALEAYAEELDPTFKATKAPEGFQVKSRYDEDDID